MATIKLFDIEIDTRPPSELIQDIVNHVGRNDPPLRIVQVNPEMIVSIYQRDSKRHLFDSADIIVANGVGVQWAATFARSNRSFSFFMKSLIWTAFRPSQISKILPARYTSSSFTAPLLKQLSTRSSHVLIAGSPKGSDIESTAVHLRDIAPGLQVTSFDTKNFVGSKKLDELLSVIERQKPAIVLLAIGYPVQEEAAQQIHAVMKNGVVITEGGTFDYQQFGGNIRRAPGFIQRIGFEWLWRLLREPWRIRRQSALLKFIWLTYRNS